MNADSLIYAPSWQGYTTHELFFEVTEACSDDQIALLAADNRVAGFVIFDAILATKLARFGKKVISCDYPTAEQGVYVLDYQYTLIDRAKLDCDNYQTPRRVRDLLQSYRAGKVLVKGEIMFSFTFRAAASRADVGDVFNLCRSGAAGVVIDGTITASDKASECVQCVSEVFLVFEHEFAE